MALGRQLVEELELEPSVDTLGRWMGHYLAELIVRTDNAVEPKDKAAATNEAVETILRIWRHRSTYNRINPLADLEPVFVVLRTLALDAPPWGYGSKNTYTNSARQTYELLQRLTICFSLLELGGVEIAKQAFDRAERTGKWQSEEEREIVQHLSGWMAAISGELNESRRASTGTVARDAPSISSIDLTETALRILDDVQTAAADLRKTLQEPEN